MLAVSPLIALQRDQRDGLAEADAPDAVVVTGEHGYRTLAREAVWRQGLLQVVD